MSRSDCSFARLSNGLRLAYVEQGRRDGPVVILLHGLSDSHRSFDLLMPHLPASWRAIALTARGHGRSDKPDEKYNVTDMASDVNAFMAALGIERALIVGHSMGAATALQFAADYPERTAGLVLIGAFANFADNPGVAELVETVGAFQEHLDPEFVLAFQESTFAEMIPQRFLDVVVGESMRCPTFVWPRVLDGLVNASLIGAARRVLTPTLLIHGAKDAFVPHADQLALRDALPSARLFSMPKVGHTPHWERPAETSALLQAFAGEIADTAALMRGMVG